MRIIFTGGHITPALAVIEEMKAREKAKSNKYEILFLGRKYALEGEKTISQEYKILVEKNIPFVTLTTGRLQRSFTRYTIASLVKIPLGFFQALSYLKKFNPDIILSFGGYIALPVAIAGWLCRVPVITHEQTTIPGLSNKIIALIAKKVCLSWEGTKNMFPPKKIKVTGNPVRDAIFKKNQPQDFNIPQSETVIYITGGSLGSHAINEAVKQILPTLLETYTVIHQCGESAHYNDWNTLKEIQEKLPLERQKRYFLKKYVSEDEIGWILDRASLIISRAGANTITEIAILEKVAILIPLPWAGENEQMENAKILQNLGSAKILIQDKDLPQNLLKTIRIVIENINSYKERARLNSKKINREADKAIVDTINEIYQKEIS